jgi:hypothetical protein
MNRSKIGRLAQLAWMYLAGLTLMAFSAQAKLTGDRRGPNYWVRAFENSFLGFNCYVGSIASTLLRIVTPNNPSRSEYQLSKFFGSAQSITERLTTGNRQTRTEQTRTRTYAPRRLTISPA